MTPRAILVAGASGFIGANYVESLRRAGVPFIALYRNRPERAPQNEREVVVSSLDPPSLSEALAGRDIGAVVNLASYGVRPGDREAAAMFAANVAVPVALARFAADRGVPLVHAGSCAEYAASATHRPLGEAAALESRKLYGATKAAGGLAVCATSSALGVPFAWLRFFNVYGQGEASHRLLPSLLRQLAAGQRAPLSIGTQVRDFIHVSDIVSAIGVTLRHLDVARGVEIWNVCTGAGRSVRDFAEIVARASGRDPALLGFGDIALRPDDEPFLVGDPSAMAKATGWQAHYDLESGLKLAIEAF